MTIKLDQVTALIENSFRLAAIKIRNTWILTPASPLTLKDVEEVL